MPEALEAGTALLWNKAADGAPTLVRVEPSRTERRRHLRKYAEGELPEDRSFYFRGPEGKLNLRAHNLILFMDLADGVDDETWLFHLRRGEISQLAAAGNQGRDAGHAGGRDRAQPAARCGRFASQAARADRGDVHAAAQ